jgi:hypothetical protein
MSLVTRIQSLTTAITAEFNDHKSARGDLASLSTTNKSNLVAALNEIYSALSGIEGVAINDSSSSSTTETWSITKIASEISSAISALVAGAPGALDTLNELATALGDADDTITALLNGQAKRVRVDAAQTFSPEEKTQGLENLGGQSAAAIGDTDTDFATAFTAGLT